MKFTAKLIKVLEPQKGVGKNGEWQKDSAIFETDGMYPKKICVTFWNKQDEVSKLIINNQYDVSFDLESREYNGNWYSDIRVWRIDPLGVEAKPTNQPAPTPPPVDFNKNNDDDLPF